MELLLQNNYLHTDTGIYRCAIGDNGVSTNKVEGDLCTPAGIFKFISIYYRPDKVGVLKFLLPSIEITENDGWCDDPSSEFYNKHIRFPFEKSAERLYRDDDLYDILCVIDYNIKPTIPGKGSAIFLHIARPRLLNTEGCIAIEKEEMIKLSQKIEIDTKLIIKP
jgi:L,D-peptidoglycan transpeptidase YkuD (ErfK/YbiS/YcfS/YnhG family)